MVREKPKGFYFAKPVKFGNGAKLKAYKKYIDKEMVIMTKDRYKEFLKKVKSGRDVSDKEAEKNDKAMAKKWQEVEDRNTDELVKELKANDD